MHTSSYPVLAAGLQSLALKVFARSRLAAKALPLVYPRTTLYSGGASFGNIYDEVFCDLIYESPKPLPPRPRLVDAGAHLGLASLFFLNRYPDSHVTCIEANPNIAPLLRRNLAPWLDRVSIHEAALSNRSGTVRFCVTQDNLFNVTGGIDNRESRDVLEYEVPCLDAAEVLREPVDLMKLDVEGHEYELLRLDLFRPEHISNLVIEFHDIRGNGKNTFLETMCELSGRRGYRVANSQNVQLDRAAVEAVSGSTVLKLF